MTFRGHCTVPIINQVRRLAQAADAGVVRFAVALLGIDVFFVAVFVAQRLYRASFYDYVPMIGERWHLGLDWSYPEVFGYLKTLIIVSLLITIPGKRHRPICLALILIFTVVLLDDAAQVHERLGQGLAGALGFQWFAGRISRHFGELIVWGILSVLLLAGLCAALVRSPRQDRTNGLLFLAAIAVLALFAVVADLAHVLANNRFRGADLLFTLIEEGGEQMTLSLICGLTLLIHREQLRRASDS